MREWWLCGRAPKRFGDEDCDLVPRKPGFSERRFQGARAARSAWQRISSCLASEGLSSQPIRVIREQHRRLGSMTLSDVRKATEFEVAQRAHFERWCPSYSVGEVGIEPANGRTVTETWSPDAQGYWRPSGHNQWAWRKSMT